MWVIWLLIDMINNRILKKTIKEKMIQQQIFWCLMVLRGELAYILCIQCVNANAIRRKICRYVYGLRNVNISWQEMEVEII